MAKRAGHVISGGGAENANFATTLIYGRGDDDLPPIKPDGLKGFAASAIRTERFDAPAGHLCHENRPAFRSPETQIAATRQTRCNGAG